MRWQQQPVGGKARQGRAWPCHSDLAVGFPVVWNCSAIRAPAVPGSIELTAPAFARTLRPGYRLSPVSGSPSRSPDGTGTARPHSGQTPLTLPVRL